MRSIEDIIVNLIQRIASFNVNRMRIHVSWNVRKHVARDAGTFALPMSSQMPLP